MNQRRCIVLPPGINLSKDSLIGALQKEGGGREGLIKHDLTWHNNIFRIILSKLSQLVWHKTVTVQLLCLSLPRSVLLYVEEKVYW